MKPLLIIFIFLCSAPLIWADDQKPPAEPTSAPAYQRQGEGWVFGCWLYEDSRAVHGRLVGKDGEVFGKHNGETIKTSFGTLVWRGPYSPNKAPEKSTGWLFVESFSGPAYIRDGYDPKTGALK